MFKTQLIMTNQVNFKKVEVKGYTKQEAVAQAPFQVFVMLLRHGKLLVSPSLTKH